jgi:uncharacterized membrane protein/protein-disulfide isomerase
MKERAFATYGALAAAIAGFGASLATAIDDLGPEPTFCNEACDVVRQSVWAKPLGIPMSLLGVLFFAAMIGLAFVERPRLRRLLAVAGAAWAIWLVVLQGFVIEAWCKLCLVADPAAIAVAIFVLAGAKTIRPGTRPIAVSVVGLAAIVAGLALWTRSTVLPASDGPIPEFVAKAQVPGKVTIVEVVDFECPFCRKMQTRLDEALARTKTPVEVVRKMMPLPMHQYAVPAAVAWCLADDQGKGDEMAHALFAADPDDLHFDDCKKLAVQLGCDLDRFVRDVPICKQRVMADIAEVRAAGIAALPTMFIGNRRFTGATLTTEDLVRIIDSTRP